MKKKRALLKKIIAALTVELERFAVAARKSHAEATHEQSKAEHKYDTRGLEAAYLAGGQARKVAELEESITLFQKLSLREFDDGQLIDLSALVEVKMGGASNVYFIGPRHGGLEIIHSGEEITVITPQSPLGAELIGRKQGDKFLFGPGKMACQITSVI